MNSYSFDSIIRNRWLCIIALFMSFLTILVLLINSFLNRPIISLAISISALVISFLALCVVAFQASLNVPKIKCFAHKRSGKATNEGEWSFGILLNNKRHCAFYVSIQNMTNAPATIKSIQIINRSGNDIYYKAIVLWPTRDPIIVNLSEHTPVIGKKMKYRVNEIIPYLSKYNILSLRDYHPFTIKPYDYQHIIIAVPADLVGGGAKTEVKIAPSSGLWRGQPKIITIQGWGESADPNSS